MLGLGLFAFSISRQPADTDEAWLGEQAYYRALDGTARSPMVPGAHGEEHRVVVQHKLLVETGALAITLFGWGLWPLRVVPVVFTMALLFMVGIYAERHGPPGSGWLAAGLLILSPVCFHWGKIFRPEMLVAACAFGCLLLMQSAYRAGSVWRAVVAGMLAGGAACAHYNGMTVIAAAAATFLILRRYRLGLAVLVGAGLALTPHLWEIVRYRELFIQQLFDNPMIAGKVGGSWMTWLLSLLEEHKRLFRSPEILVITVPFCLALLSVEKGEFHRRKVWYIFWVLLLFFVAVVVKSKLTRYALLLHPFFVGEIVRTWSRPMALAAGRFRAILTWTFPIVATAGMLGALIIDVQATARSAEAPEKISARWAHGIPEHSTVVAPLNFAFDQIDKYHIIALAHVRFNLVHDFAGEVPPTAFFAACAELQAEYLIIPRGLPEFALVGAGNGENLYQRYREDSEVVVFHRLPPPDKNRSGHH